MKSQRRHDLRENVLGHELSQSWQFVKRYGNYFLWGLLITVLVAMLIAFAVKAKGDNDRKVATDFFDLNNSSADADPRVIREGYARLTDQTRNRDIAAMSCIALGDKLSRELLVISGKADQGERNAMITDAARFYEKAINLFPDKPLATTQAYLGLARLAENVGKFDEAKKYYQAAIQVAPPGTPFKQQAQAGLDSVDSLSRPVRMATTAPSTQPASAPAK